MAEEKKDLKLNNNYSVVMSNNLIKSKSNLSLNAIKLLRIAIAQVVKEDKDLKTYTVSIKDLAKFLNVNVRDVYREADKITTELLKEVVRIGDGNPEHKWHKFQWCSSCSYENGIITIKLHDDLKPHLINLSKLYTSIIIQDLICLKSVFSIRVYELIRQEMKYQKVYADNEANIYLSIDTIRKATNTEDKYDTVSMFRKRVIDKAVDEINEKLNYYITYTVKKEDKKIVGFYFNLKSRVYANYIGVIDND